MLTISLKDTCFIEYNIHQILLSLLIFSHLNSLLCTKKNPFHYYSFFNAPPTFQFKFHLRIIYNIKNTFKGAALNETKFKDTQIENFIDLMQTTRATNDKTRRKRSTDYRGEYS